MMFWLVWDTVWAVIGAVLFGATLASPDRSVAKIIAICCLLIGIFAAVAGIFIWGDIALGVP